MVKKKLKKVIVILGQTSTGKSDLGVLLAQHLNGEIVSADSRQVYKGLNLLSGKITKKEMGGVPHYLLDVVTPKKVYSVSEYVHDATRVIEKILERGKIPLIVGGTGFYIDALVDGIILPEVLPNTLLRKELEKKSPQELFAMLKKLDSRRAKTIDSENKVRLIRAIEIAKALGKVPKQKIKPRYEALKIGMTLPDQEFKERIYNRILKRIKQGMLREAYILHEKGLTFKRMESLGLECRFASLYLQKKITKSEFIHQLAFAIWHYAKRQKTWFKRDKNIIWTHLKEEQKVLNMCKQFLQA